MEGERFARINALKVIDAIGLRSLQEIEVDGKMVVGVHCIGIKDGMNRELFMYQPFDNQESVEKWGMQAVVAQTGFGAAIAIELIGKGIWQDTGVYSPEYFDPIPYLEIMEEAGYKYGLVEMDSEYKEAQDKKVLHHIFEDVKKNHCK